MIATRDPFPEASKTKCILAACPALLSTGFPVASGVANEASWGYLLDKNYACDESHDPTWAWQDGTAKRKFWWHRYDLVKVSVDASDPDAIATGDAKCSTDTAHCSGERPVADERTAVSDEIAEEEIKGTCVGTAAETWPHRVYVECKSEPSQVQCGLIACPLGQQAESGPTSLARIVMLGNGQALGAIFTPALGWASVEPACFAHDGLVTCGIGLEAEDIAGVRL